MQTWLAYIVGAGQHEVWTHYEELRSMLKLLSSDNMTHYPYHRLPHHGGAWETGRRAHPMRNTLAYRGRELKWLYIQLIYFSRQMDLIQSRTHMFF
jgi:hypothetical protein